MRGQHWTAGCVLGLLIIFLVACGAEQPIDIDSIITHTFSLEDCAKGIERSGNSRTRKWFLLLSIIVNVGTLVWFKYLGLFATTYQGIVGGLRAIGITPYIGQFISSGFFTVWNWLWYSMWVFKKQKPAHKKQHAPWIS